MNCQSLSTDEDTEEEIIIIGFFQQHFQPGEQPKSAMEIRKLDGPEECHLAKKVQINWFHLAAWVPATICNGELVA